MTVISERLTPRSNALRGRRRLDVLPVSAALFDLALISLAALLAVYGREQTHLFSRTAEVHSTLGLIGPLTVAGWVTAIYVIGGYRSDVFGAGTDEYKRVAQAVLYTAALLGIGCYLTKFPLSRGFYLLLFVVGGPLLLAGRLILRRFVHAARRRGALGKRVLISGSLAHIDEIAGVLRREPWLGYHVVGALTPSEELAEETPGGVPVVGNVDDVALAATTGVDVVFFAGGAHTSASEMRRTVWELEHHAVDIVVAPSVTDISGERMRMRPVGGLPLVHIDPPTWTDASRLGKRSFDVLGSGLLLVALSPILLVAAVWVRLHDGGPILYRHPRVGRDGESFSCLKFRSMHVDADQKIQQLQLEEGRDALLFKMKDDPRITPPGRWLRRLSVDELPQLVNVLRGEMSLVGPRPQVDREVALYDDAMARRLHVRPGLTGLWQVSGRSDLTPEEAMRMDLYYVDNWSMLQDLSILGRTLGAVVSSRGAY